MRAADGALLALTGMIAGAALHHTIRGLVSTPEWLMIAVGCAFAASVLAAIYAGSWRVDGAGSCAWLAAGLVAGLTLPADLPPARSVVSSHVPWGLIQRQAAASGAMDLFAALETLDEDPQRLLGRRVSVIGTWRPAGTDAASVSERVMACCAADAIDVGFDVLTAHPGRIAPHARVRVSGVVRAVLRDGETRYLLDDAVIIAL